MIVEIGLWLQPGSGQTVTSPLWGQECRRGIMSKKLSPNSFQPFQQLKSHLNDLPRVVSVSGTKP